MKNYKLGFVIGGAILGGIFSACLAYYFDDIKDVFKKPLPIEAEYLKESVMCRRIVRGPAGTLAPQDITYVFSKEGHASVYSVFRWDDKPSDRGKHKITHRWYSGGKKIYEACHAAHFYKSPRIYYSTVAAIILDSGKNHVEIYVDDRLFARHDFEIK